MQLNNNEEKFYKNYDEYFVNNFIDFCKDNNLEDTEESYEIFLARGPIFQTCFVNEIIERLYPILLYYDDSGYHFLKSQTAILGTYHFVARFPDFDQANAYALRNPKENKNPYNSVIFDTLNISKKPTIRWWVLKDAKAYDGSENERTVINGGLYRSWCATYEDTQVAYHNEYFCRETQAWERVGLQGFTIGEIPKDFESKYREVSAAECSYGSEAWLLKWNVNKVKIDSDDSSKSADIEDKTTTEESTISTKEKILNKIELLVQNNFLSSEVSGLLKDIIEYIEEN